MSIKLPAATPAERALYDEIVRRIVAATDPERIVLFGSRARGDHRPDSDIDILVIMESTEPRYARSIPLYRAVRDIAHSIDIAVYTPCEVWEWSNVPLAFISIATAEGRVLYERQSGFLRPLELRPESRIRSNRDLVDAWIDKAESDLAAARICLEAGVALSNVCFHSQQAAEKSLKAYLISIEVRFPFTRNLEELADLCARHDSSFSSVKERASRLTPYAMELRYDPTFWPSRGMAEDAYRSAHCVKVFVSERLYNRSDAR